MNRFLHNLSLLLFRLTLGSLVVLFAAKELAKKWTLIQPVIEYYDIPGADWVYVIVGVLILLLGVGLVVGFYTRLMALLLFAFLAFGTTFYKPVDGGVTFQLIALYGVGFLSLLIGGGGQWSVKRSGSGFSAKASVLESEQSLLSSRKDARSIFEKEEEGQEVEPEGTMSTLQPPQANKALMDSEEGEPSPTVVETEEEDYQGDDTELDKR